MRKKGEKHVPLDLNLPFTSSQEPVLRVPNTWCNMLQSQGKNVIISRMFYEPQE